MSDLFWFAKRFFYIVMDGLKLCTKELFQFVSASKKTKTDMHTRCVRLDSIQTNKLEIDCTFLNILACIFC